MSKVNASIVRVTAVTGGTGESMLVENCGSVGDSQELTATLKSTIAAKKHGYPSISFTYDGESGAFAVGETITFSGNAVGTGELLFLDDVGLTMEIRRLTGDIPVDDTVLTGEGTGAADVAGSVSAVAAYYGEPSSSPQYLAWRIANMGVEHIDVAFGTTPDATITTATAASTAKKGVPAGVVAYFGVAKFGDFVIYVDA